jgi:hypothetical protein
MRLQQRDFSPATNVRTKITLQILLTRFTRKRVHPGSFKSVSEPERTIHDYLEIDHKHPEPLIGSDSAYKIIENFNCGKQAL